MADLTVNINGAPTPVYLGESTALTQLARAAAEAAAASALATLSDVEAAGAAQVDAVEAEGAIQIAAATAQANAAAGYAANIASARFIDGFSAITGFFRGDTQANTGATSYSINGSGQIVPTLLIARMSWATISPALSRNAGMAMEYTVEAQVATDYVGTGPIIAVGTGDARRFYAYLASGELAVYDRNNTLLSVMGAANAPGGNNGVSRFRANLTAKLRLVAFPDDTGYLEAVHPSGQIYRYEITGIPTGEIAVGWRLTTSGLIDNLTARPMSTSWREEYRRDKKDGLFGPVRRETVILPDLPTGAATGGATYTGLDRITRGKWAGCWVLGSDGRKVEGDGTPLKPQIVIVTPDFRRVIQVIDLGIDATLQGVAVDTSGAADTVWAAIPRNGAIGGDVRHFNLYDVSYTNYGAATINAAVEIVGDRYDFYTAHASQSPNGLAYNAASDSLYIAPGGPGQNSVREVSCDPAASPRHLSTLTIQTDADHLFYDAEKSRLFYTRGSNGVNGDVYLHDIAANTSKIFYTGLQHAQAIEGLFFDKVQQELIVINDGGYHATASPALNVALRYSVTIA